MFCSACGTAIPAGQTACPQCGQPALPPAPPVPGLEFEIERYRGNVRVLAIVWFAYAGLTVLLGFAGLTAARHFMMGGGFGFRMYPNIPPEWMNLALRFGWAAILIRTALCLAAAWGLLEHAPWGRIVALVAAFLSLLKFPFGTALGIWTLIVLLGFRNATLYDRL